MAEAGMAAYGTALGVAIVMAITAFSLRQRRPHGSEMEQLLTEAEESKME